MQNYFKALFLILIILSVALVPLSAEEDTVIDLSISAVGGNLLMYLVNDEEEYIAQPYPIVFETYSFSFNPVDVEGVFGTADQKLRIENGTPAEISLAIALDVSNFENDAKWNNVEEKTS
jgi:hypothetical protein